VGQFLVRRIFCEYVGINEDIIRWYVKFQEEQEPKEESNQHSFDFDLEI
jgi:hypothetical protein